MYENEFIAKLSMNMKHEMAHPTGIPLSPIGYFPNDWKFIQKKDLGFKGDTSYLRDSELKAWSVDPDRKTHCPNCGQHYMGSPTWDLGSGKKLKDTCQVCDKHPVVAPCIKGHCEWGGM